MPGRPGIFAGGAPVAMPQNSDADPVAASVPAERVGKLEAHGLAQKWSALGAAGLLILGLAWLEVYMVWQMRDPQFWQNDLAVLLVISPILAMTAIMVFVLLGAFREPSDPDAKALPVAALSRLLHGE